MDRQAFFQALAGRGFASFFGGFWSVFVFMLAFGFWTVALVRASRRAANEQRRHSTVVWVAGLALFPLFAGVVISAWPQALLRLVGASSPYQLSPHGVTHILDSLRALVYVDVLAVIVILMAFVVVLWGDQVGAGMHEKPPGGSGAMEGRALRETRLTDLGLSTRVARSLGREGVTTLGQLIDRRSLGGRAVLETSGIGPKALEEIDRILEELGVLHLCNGDAETQIGLRRAGDRPQPSQVPGIREVDEREGHEEHAVAPRCTLTLENVGNVLGVKHISVDGKPWWVRRVQSTHIRSTRLMFSRDGRSIRTQDVTPGTERDHHVVVYDPQNRTWSALVVEKHLGNESMLRVLTRDSANGRWVVLGSTARFEVAGLVFRLALAAEAD